MVCRWLFGCSACHSTHGIIVVAEKIDSRARRPRQRALAVAAIKPSPPPFVQRTSTRPLSPPQTRCSPPHSYREQEGESNGPLAVVCVELFIVSIVLDS
jgi:hypothetical protein